MPPYVTTHIHTDGPIPGPHSLLTLGSAAHDRDGSVLGTFTVNLRELHGATLHPVALETWRARAEDWLSTRRASRPPALATTAYARWLDQLPGRPTLVTDPTEPDYLFVYWYLHRFVGHWPFARTETDPELVSRFAPVALCRLTSCQEALTRTS